MSKARTSVEVDFKKADDELRIVWGEVYVPWTGEDVPPMADRDTHGHWARPEEIRKMAYGFMEQLRLTKIDKQHDEDPDEGVVVESFIARENDPDFVPGSWVLGTRVLKDETWQAIKKGDITGYSIDGTAHIVPDDEQDQNA